MMLTYTAECDSQVGDECVAVHSGPPNQFNDVAQGIMAVEGVRNPVSGHQVSIVCEQ
jgi:hypothetical protein